MPQASLNWPWFNNMLKLCPLLYAQVVERQLKHFNACLFSHLFSEFMPAEYLGEKFWGLWKNPCLICHWSILCSNMGQFKGFLKSVSYQNQGFCVVWSNRHNSVNKGLCECANITSVAVFCFPHPSSICNCWRIMAGRMFRLKTVYCRYYFYWLIWQ